MSYYLSYEHRLKKLAMYDKTLGCTIRSRETYAPDSGADTPRIDSRKIACRAGFVTISCSGSESSSGTTVAGVSYGPNLIGSAIISVAALCVGDVGDSKVGRAPPKSSTYFEVQW